MGSGKRREKRRVMGSWETKKEAVKRERRILREAAKRELEKDVRELGEAIEDKDDIEREDIVEAHGRMLR